MIKRLLFLSIFFEIAVGAYAQTIPKSIDKPVNTTVKKPVAVIAKKNTQSKKKYDNIWLTNDDGLKRAEVNGKMGLINLKGELLTPIKYDEISNMFYDGFAVVKLDGKHGIIDKFGKEVIPPVKYDMVVVFSSGLFRVLSANGYGIINENGDLIVPDKYKAIEGINEGLASILLNKKYGYLDELGKIVIPLKYDEAYWRFKNGQALVKLNGKEFYIDTKGNCIKDCPEMETQKTNLPEMVYVTGGTFNMGSEDGEADEKPIHQVTVSSFYMGKYEITQAQWQLVMGNNPSKFNDCSNCPVENVSWDDVQQFLVKLNAKTGKNYRLPTEAEWEYAARGGQKFSYAGSNNIGEVAWYKEGKTHPVGQMFANGYGLYDMTGNVWEWCNDWFSASYYSNSPSNNPKGSSSGSTRVLRGGSWYSAVAYCRVAFRSGGVPGKSTTDLGFRILVSE